MNKTHPSSRFRRALLPLLLTTLLPGLVGARNLMDHVEEGSLLIMQISDFPSYREKLNASPMSAAWGQIEWKELLLSFAQAAAEEGEEDLPAPAEMRAELEKAEARINTFLGHLSGEVLFVTGNMRQVAGIFKEHQGLREQFQVDWGAMQWGEDFEMDPETEEKLHQDALLDAKETQAFAGDIYFMAEVREGAALMETLADWARENLQEDDSEDFPQKFVEHQWGPHTVHTLVPDLDEEADAREKQLAALEVAPWWTVVDDVFLVAFTEGGLRSAIERLEQRPGNRLTNTPAFLSTMAFHDQPDTFFYLNFPAIDPLLRSVSDGDEALVGDLSLNKIFDWLALDALVPLSISFQMRPEGVASLSRYGFERETALSRILLDPTDAPAPEPAFVSKQAGQVVSTHWSLGRFYEQLENEVKTLAPEAAGAMGMARMAGFGVIGIDYKTQLLDHFDSGFVLVSQTDVEVAEKLAAIDPMEDMETYLQMSMEHPTRGSYYLLGLQLKDEQAVTSALNTMMRRIYPDGAPEPEDILGHPVYFPLTAMPGGSPNMSKMIGYTFLDGYLVISLGSSRMLQEAIAANNDPNERLWGTPGFLEARDHLPPRSQGLNFTAGKELEATFQVMQSSMQSAGNFSGGAFRFPDLTPLGKLFRVSVGSSQLRDLVTETKSLMLYGQPE
ncbi:MAG: hypothetical protein JJU29_17745 [Verrucomicrobia bacterium]|nr:hypothetical protein [Verrucomicrobiota bacterium]MCH8513927.1 hypothetical protein [Kiritimatiellia bacterium]